MFSPGGAFCDTWGTGAQFITEYCHDRIMMASDIAKFMNGAGKIHERFMNRKKTTAAVSCAIHERLRFFIPAHI